MSGTVENVGVYFDASAIVVESYQHDRVRTPEIITKRVRATQLRWLLIFTHLVTACAFTLAAAFTSEFLLLRRFWLGVLLGVVIYGLILIAAWACERLDPGS